LRIFAPLYRFRGSGPASRLKRVPRTEAKSNQDYDRSKGGPPFTRRV
jgi:hypothetical protein